MKKKLNRSIKPLTTTFFFKKTQQYLEYFFIISIFLASFYSNPEFQGIEVINDLMFLSLLLLTGLISLPFFIFKLKKPPQDLFDLLRAGTICFFLIAISAIWANVIPEVWHHQFNSNGSIPHTNLEWLGYLFLFPAGFAQLLFPFFRLVNFLETNDRKNRIALAISSVTNLLHFATGNNLLLAVGYLLSQLF